MSETIQLITSVGALLLGAAYVVGGLIVNLHLSRYGVTEYQVLRVKYLVVGLIYILISIGLLILSSAELLLSYLFPSIFPFKSSTVSSIVSLIASFLLLFLGYLYPKRFSRLSYSWLWIIFVGFSSSSLIYPLQIVSYQTITQSPTPQGTLQICVAILIGILSFIGQIYFYSRYIYGNADVLDAIGMGIPVKVKLAGTEENITLLAHMGLPTQPPDMTAEVLLIDETDDHYILGTGANSSMKVYKIDKALIKGIVYL